MIEGHAGMDCEICHDFGGGVTQKECGDSECHGGSGSHPIHITENSKGPDPVLACDACHNTGSYPSFIDDSALSETQVCDPCHSPGGAFNGVVSTGDSIGAKDNWSEGVYNEDSALKPDKEKWCAGCHDNVPAFSQQSLYEIIIDGS